MAVDRDKEVCVVAAVPADKVSAQDQVLVPFKRRRDVDGWNRLIVIQNDFNLDLFLQSVLFEGDGRGGLGGDVVLGLEGGGLPTFQAGLDIKRSVKSVFSHLVTDAQLGELVFAPPGKRNVIS